MFVLRLKRNAQALFLQSSRFINCKIPATPIYTEPDEEKLPNKTVIDRETIEHLERLSLVNFGNEDGVRIVENAIRFADRIFEVDTKGIEPLITVLEDQ